MERWSEMWDASLHHTVSPRCRFDHSMLPAPLSMLAKAMRPLLAPILSVIGKREQCR